MMPHSDVYGAKRHKLAKSTHTHSGTDKDSLTHTQTYKERWPTSLGGALVQLKLNVNFMPS